MEESTDMNLANLELSESVNFLAFATERQKEIQAMTNSISNPSTTKLIFQKLPPQMRRRVMSHNSKRLPVRLREGHMNQLAKSGLPPASKRPSRSYRRRPKNLVLEYNRRQRNKFWLETHIWHAKRFHMVERWGYKLAEASCDKAFRAAFRATSEHCLLQDISYYECIQLSGDLDNLLDGLRTITNPKCGYTFAAKGFLRGNREGSVEIFDNLQPCNAIGKVSFLWNPLMTENHRILWLFVHPSYKAEVLELLLKVFTMTEKHNEDFDDTKDKDNQCKKLSDNVLQYENEKGVVLEKIRDVNRFSLTGPLANAILSDSLKEMSDPLKQKNEKEHWAHTYFEEATNMDIYKIQCQFWNLIKDVPSPSELRPHMVLGLNILDPRLQGNIKRTKSVAGVGAQYDINDVPELLHHSAIWDKKIRENISNNMVSNGELCKLRNKFNLVPGEDSLISNFVQGIPILLIQRPGLQSGKIGYGCGWDILFPQKYAMPIWLMLIMHGARAGGLRESRSICFESQKHYLPPDTKAGKMEDCRIYKELRAKYFRMPPDKRVNYIKMGINSPFKCPWQLLVNEWSEVPSDSFHVLREVALLQSLQMHLTNNSSIDINPHINYLIPISLTMVKKGLCKNFSIICLPEAQDMRANKLIHVSPPIEKIHPDENQEKRRNERIMHLTLLKRLKRRRILTRKSEQSLLSKSESLKKLNSEKLVKDQLDKMQQLWLPESTKTSRYQCSRQVMGYVTNGAFSFTQHTGMCIGYVTLNSLILLRKQFNRNIVLVRNPTSRKYSFAFIQIIK